MRHSAVLLRRRALSMLIRAALASPFVAATAQGGTITVTNTNDGGAGSLLAAVQAAGSGDTIVFDCGNSFACPATLDISTSGNNQGFPGPTAFAISGKSITIDGTGGITLHAHPGSTSATSLRLFYIDTGSALDLRNVTLTGAQARGGNAGFGWYTGGAGAGLGGAIFNQGALTLSGVSILANAATGGSAPFGNFDCPWVPNYIGYCPTTYTGGGGGLGGDGGNSYVMYGAARAGGGGGTGGNGLLGSGNYSGNGGPGFGGTGGGPGASGSGTGGAGLNGGGGGGGGVFSGHGGAGSDGAGGGGIGGAGGFGGGGGGNGGNAGFGGGGGAPYGVQGWGGGFGSAFYQGGGGAALGGGIFNRSGGTLAFGSGSGSISGNAIYKGFSSYNGYAFGSGLFLHSSSSATFALGGGLLTIADTITSDCAEDPTLESPKPVLPPCSDGGIAVNSGTLVLTGADGFNGPTTINGGTLRVDGALTRSATTVNNGGTLGGTGTVQGVTLNSGGSIAPGDSPGVLHATSLTWNGDSAMKFELGATNSTADSDLLQLSGTLTKGSAGTFTFQFSDGNGAPALNTTYTLITFAGPTNFAVGDFSYDYTGANPSLVGVFAIADLGGGQQALQFTATTTPVRLQSFEVD